MRVTILSIGLASFFMLAGTLAASVRKPWLHLFLVAALLKLFLFIVLALRDGSFKWVIADYGAAMAVILVLQVPSIGRGNTRRAAWFIAGITVSALAALVQQGGLSLHRHFSHNDLYHVVQAVALFFMLKGASLLRDTR